MHRSLLLTAIILQCLFLVPTAFTLTRNNPSSNQLFQRRRYSPMSSSLIPSTAVNVRGGGGANPESDDNVASKNKKDDTPKERSVEEIQDEALCKISSCVKMACLLGVVGTSSVLWESYQRTGGTTFTFNLKEQGDLFIHLFNFVFGAGLHQAYQLFQQARGVDRMSPPNQLKLMQTLSRLWLITSVLLTVDGVGMAWDLHVPKAVGIFSVLFVGNFPLGEWFHRRRSSIMGKNHQEETALQAAEEYAPARTAGLGAARNMMWVVGTLTIAALIDVVKYTVNTMKAQGAGDKAGVLVGGLMEVGESVAITGLLASLYKTLLRTALVATQRKFSSKDPAYKEYYEAQSKFYGKVASFFGYQALFVVLGYVAQVGEKMWFKYGAT